MRRSVLRALFTVSGTFVALEVSTASDARAEDAAALVAGPSVTPAPLAPAPPAPAPPASLPPDAGSFEFGSYGRVRIASDLRGGVGRSANVVTHGTRIDEDSYAELELRREDTWKAGAKTKVVASLALFSPFFHFSGTADARLAVRNLFVQGALGKVTLWGGSRMYRGDDVYLLNWWPLDNQNTVGGGAGYALGPDTTVAAHVGMQRLDNPYQSQELLAVAPFGSGTVAVQKLDRPRTIETLKITHLARNGRLFSDPKAGFKLAVVGEAHQVSAGVARDVLTGQDRGLPQDSGFMVGAQLGVWTGARDTHVNLFMRHARGLAAYDPLAAPETFANDKATTGATESLVALGFNYEQDAIGLAGGAYLRAFRDGNPSPTTPQKFDEGTIVLRPQLYLGDHWGVAAEGSFQARRIAVPDPDQTSQPLTASLWRFGVMPYFSPAGRGTFKRPQLRLIYLATARNSGAQRLYAAEDVFAQRSVEHFAGLNVEWWFNSSSYP